MAKYVYYNIQVPNEIILTENYEDVEFQKYFDNNLSNGNFHPILPGLKAKPLVINLNGSPYGINKEITWNVYADNARSKNGKLKFSSVKYIDNVHKEW